MEQTTQRGSSLSTHSGKPSVDDGWGRFQPASGGRLTTIDSSQTPAIIAATLPRVLSHRYTSKKARGQEIKWGGGAFCKKSRKRGVVL